MNQGSKSVLPIYRLENLSDAVFAVALTLLVLNITVPLISDVNISTLANELIKLWPKFLIYAITFFVIGIFWIGHRLMFHYIERADRKLLWMNNLLLMLVSFIPFSANLLGAYPLVFPASIGYGSTLCAASIFYFLVWKHALKKHLVRENLEPSFIKKANLVVAMPAVLYALSVVCAVFSPLLSIVLYILIPLLYTLPGPIDDLIPKE